MDKNMINYKDTNATEKDKKRKTQKDTDKL